MIRIKGAAEKQRQCCSSGPQSTLSYCLGQFDLEFLLLIKNVSSKTKKENKNSESSLRHRGRVHVLSESYTPSSPCNGGMMIWTRLLC